MDTYLVYLHVVSIDRVFLRVNQSFHPMIYSDFSSNFIFDRECIAEVLAWELYILCSSVNFHPTVHSSIIQIVGKYCSSLFISNTISSDIVAQGRASVYIMKSFRTFYDIQGMVIKTNVAGCQLLPVYFLRIGELLIHRSLYSSFCNRFFNLWLWNQVRGVDFHPTRVFEVGLDSIQYLTMMRGLVL
jgi:hypothetical protein